MAPFPPPKRGKEQKVDILFAQKLEGKKSCVVSLWALPAVLVPLE